MMTVVVVITKQSSRGVKWKNPLFVVLFVVLIGSFTDAFQWPSSSVTIRQNKVSSLIPLSALDPSLIPFEDIDAARIQYEALIGPLLFTAPSITTTGRLKSRSSSMVGQITTSTTTNTMTTTNNNTIPTKLKPLLTNIGRKRRMIEIKLLQSLLDSDDAIDELMKLWMEAECSNDAVATMTLKLMEEDCSTGQEEEALRTILKNTNGLWVEPMNRLALLLFLKHEYVESQELVSAVLQEKPWHFEAVQLQVLLELSSKSSKTSRVAAALRWARKGLPPLQHPKRRKKWVQNAIEQAQHSLYQMEEQSYRVRHDHSFSTNNSNNHWIDSHQNIRDNGASSAAVSVPASIWQ